MSIPSLIGIAWLIFFVCWCVWPARYSVRLELRSRCQQVRVRVTLLGFQTAIEAQRRTQPTSALVSPAGGADVDIGLEFRILGRLRIARRFPRLRVTMEGMVPFVWLWEEWAVYVPRLLRAAWSREEEPARAGGIWRRLTWVFALTHPFVQAVGPFVTVRSAEVEIAVGTGDAASTARLVGLMWLGWGAAMSRVQERWRWHQFPRFRVYPVFDRRCFDVDACASATVRQGWLMLAGLLAVFRYGWRRCTESRRTSPASAKAGELGQRAPSHAQPRA